MKLSLFLVVLLGVAICHVNGGCVKKDTLEGAISGTVTDVKVGLGVEEEESGLKKFFKNLGCDIADAGRSVQKGVESGYDYLKDKLTPEKKVTDIDVRSAMDDLADKVKP